MGIWNIIRRDEDDQGTTRDAMQAARKGEQDEGALQRLVEKIRDLGIDGTIGYASAAKAADHARRGRAKKRPEKAVKRLIRSHRRGVTVGGFLTGLGGFITLPVLLPTNVLEFYVQSTRMVAGIAAVRGYDLDDPEIRTRIMATLMAEESGELLSSVGLGPVAGAASRAVAGQLPSSMTSEVLSAFGSRILRKFGLRSARLFGKAVPGLGAVLGAWADRRQLNKIAKAAREGFPAR
ncbi:EcsC family protein [Brachybacterium squillarum]|uniref:EcsC family protein n=1 Tax=Brachybacterium squillarum TaxID=661979 RepID=UPI0002629CDE|nr:EcsC family protein [Brachybacterium squillarum]